MSKITKQELYDLLSSQNDLIFQEAFARFNSILETNSAKFNEAARDEALLRTAITYSNKSLFNVLSLLLDEE